jgi:hypothetical protein
VRLGAQDAEAVPGKQRRHDVVVFGAAAARRQDHDDRAQSLRDHLDVYVATFHHETLVQGPVYSDV